MPVEVRGVETVLKAFGKARRETSERIEDSLRKCAEILLRASQPLVPVETGFLKESGHVEVRGKGLHCTASVVYEARYAIYVHENLQAYHEPPTQARYLADAVPKVRGTMTALLKRQLTAGTRALE
jgi:hypothetical protein